jgi:ATP-dependent protease ClpP protease subunit
MLHRTTSGVQAASADRLHAIANSVILDDARTEAILREQLTLTDDQWRQHQSAELWFSAQESIAGRLALAIEEFSPPVGTPVFNV